jgi:hypothetical protein
MKEFDGFDGFSAFVLFCKVLGMFILRGGPSDSEDPSPFLGFSRRGGAGLAAVVAASFRRYALIYSSRMFLAVGLPVRGYGRNIS